MEKRRNCSFGYGLSLGAISPLFLNIFYFLLDFHVRQGPDFRFEISEFEITRVNCISCGYSLGISQ